MEKNIIVFLSLLIAFLGNAQEFEYTYANTTLKYTVIDGSSKYCKVSLSPGVNGDVEIPKFAKTYLVTEIGDYAFSCNKLSSVIIPNSVSIIGDGAFMWCRELKSVILPNSVTSIGRNAFAACDSLSDITLPKFLTILGDRAFRGCYKLSSVTIPNTVRAIGELAFMSCKELSSIDIPNSVTSIGGNAFGDCSKLTSINVADDNPNYSSSNGVLYDLNKTTVLCVPGGYSDNTFSFPKTITTIAPEAFYRCTNITSLSIPTSVTSIGHAAFQGCVNLKEISIPNSITRIEGSVFAYCYTLGNFTIPPSITSIGSRAFLDCQTLKTIVIPNSVDSIGSNAFSGCRSVVSIAIPHSVSFIGSFAFGCHDEKNQSSLKEIYYDTEDPLQFKQNIFNDYDKPTLFVRESALNKIYTTIPWGLFENIESYDFAGLEELYEPQFEEAVTSVFNSNGIKVSNSLENLPRGFYIVVRWSVIEKMIIK